MTSTRIALFGGLIIAILLLLYSCGSGSDDVVTDAPDAPAPVADAPEVTPEPTPKPVAATPAPTPEPVAASTPAPVPPPEPTPTPNPVPPRDDAPRAVSMAPTPVLLADAGLLPMPTALRGQHVVHREAHLETLRSQYRLFLPTDGPFDLTQKTRGYPSSTINTPTGFGPSWGQFYAGASYQERIRYDDWSDGVATFGFGLGDPTRYVGLDVMVNVLDTYTDFGQDRSLSLRLHRRLPAKASIAVGWENVWHTAGTDGGSSRYVVGSKAFALREDGESPLGSVVLSAGLGDDRFLSESDFARGASGVNPFGSVAVRVARPMNAIANWTGQDLALGLSIAPVRRWPLVITPALMDVTGTAGDGARFTLSAGIGYNFRR